MNAVATLGGTVAGYAEQHRANYLAAEVVGVVDVQNDIHVRSAS